MTAPPSRKPKYVAVTVTIGIAALRSTWWRTIRNGVSPRATAAST